MIISAIQLHSKLVAGTSLIASLPLDAATVADSYIIKGITGLDTDEIQPQYYGASTGNAKFYNQILKPRIITIRVALNPQYGSGQTPSSLRDALYKTISAYRTSQIELRFMNGITAVATLTGFITKFEAGLFTVTPEVQLTVRCDFPWFRAPTETSVNLTGLSTNAFTITDDVSTAPHGFKFQLTKTSGLPVAGLTIVASPFSEWSFSLGGVIVSGSSLTTGDSIYFSSYEDDRYIYAMRAGVKTNLADKIINDSLWPLIFPGANAFTQSAAGWTWSSITYHNTFWGV